MPTWNVSTKRVITQVLPRLLIAITTGWNLLCAFQFIINPAPYVPAFNLAGEPGIAVIRSTGILFLMWNIPYIFALIDPYKWKILVITCLLMQLTGCLGETWIRTQIPVGFAFRDSLMRFILFDFAGFVLLLAAWIMVNQNRRIKYEPGVN